MYSILYPIKIQACHDTLAEEIAGNSFQGKLVSSSHCYLSKRFTPIIISANSKLKSGRILTEISRT